MPSSVCMAIARSRVYTVLLWRYEVEVLVLISNIGSHQIGNELYPHFKVIRRMFSYLPVTSADELSLDHCAPISYSSDA